MASVEKIVTPPAPVPPPSVTYKLTLTEDEAVFLQSVLGSVGGSPTTSRRKHQYTISNAFYKVGVRSTFTCGGPNDYSGSIYFT